MPRFKSREEYERWRVDQAHGQARNRALGSLLIGGGILFLLLGMSLSTPFLLGPALALAGLNGICGASLVTAGARQLTAWSRGRLAGLWAVSFLLVYATGLFFLVFPLLLAIGFAISSLSRLVARPRGLVLIAALVATVMVVILFLISRRRAARPSMVVTAPVTRRRSPLITAMGYCGMALLGMTSWFLIFDPVGRAFGLRGDVLFALGMMFVFMSPIGLVAGILAALWADAAVNGRRRLTRYALAALFLLLVNALVAAVMSAR